MARLQKPAESDRSGSNASAEQTRAALVQAGLRLFGEHGYAGTSTRDIAATAKANIGSIAYHFGGKEGLRAACAEHIVGAIGALAAQAMASEVEPSRMDAADAERQLEQILERMVTFIVASREAGEIVQFILRELAQPTAALDIIYNGVFLPMHKRLCGIWAAATGEAAESDATKLTVFTLIGQVVYFRIGRLAVMRRMGWSDIGAAEAGAILSVARDNISAIIAQRLKNGLAKEKP